LPYLRALEKDKSIAVWNGPGWSGGSLRSVYASLQGQPEWRVETLDWARDIPRFAPAILADIFLAAARES
jgi:hypothetical protein